MKNIMDIKEFKRILNQSAVMLWGVDCEEWAYALDKIREELDHDPLLAYKIIKIINN